MPFKLLEHYLTSLYLDILFDFLSLKTLWEDCQFLLFFLWNHCYVSPIKNGKWEEIVKKYQLFANIVTFNFFFKLVYLWKPYREKHASFFYFSMKSLICITIQAEKLELWRNTRLVLFVSHLTLTLCSCWSDKRMESMFYFLFVCYHWNAL